VPPRANGDTTPQTGSCDETDPCRGGHSPVPALQRHVGCSEDSTSQFRGSHVCLDRVALLEAPRSRMRRSWGGTRMGTAAHLRRSSSAMSGARTPSFSGGPARSSAHRTCIRISSCAFIAPGTSTIASARSHRGCSRSPIISWSTTYGARTGAVRFRSRRGSPLEFRMAARARGPR
jgi:hypothetical protein